MEGSRHQHRSHKASLHAHLLVQRRAHLPPGTEARGCYSWRGSSTYRAWRARSAWAPWGRWNHEHSGPLRHTFIEMSETLDDYTFHWKNTQGNPRKRGWEATAGSSHTHRARHPCRSQLNRKRCTVCPQRKNTTHGHQQKEEPPPPCPATMQLRKGHQTSNSQFPPKDFLLITAPPNLPFSSIKVFPLASEDFHVAVHSCMSWITVLCCSQINLFCW